MKIALLLFVVTMITPCNYKKDIPPKERILQKYSLLKKFNFDSVEGWIIKARNPEFLEPERAFYIRHDSIRGTLFIKKNKCDERFVDFRWNCKAINDFCDYYSISSDTVQDYANKKFTFIFDLDIKWLININSNIIFRIDSKSNYIFYFNDTTKISGFEKTYGKLTKIEKNWYYKINERWKFK